MTNHAQKRLSYCLLVTLLALTGCSKKATRLDMNSRKHKEITTGTPSTSEEPGSSASQQEQNDPELEAWIERLEKEISDGLPRSLEIYDSKVYIRLPNWLNAQEIGKLMAYLCKCQWENKLIDYFAVDLTNLSNVDISPRLSALSSAIKGTSVRYLSIWSLGGKDHVVDPQTVYHISTLLKNIKADTLGFSEFDSQIDGK